MEVAGSNLLHIKSLMARLYVKHKDRIGVNQLKRRTNPEDELKKRNGTTLVQIPCNLNIHDLY